MQVAESGTEGEKPPGWWPEADWKRDRKLETCTCPMEWRDSMGTLYGIRMMGGWVRTLDVKTCPHHGERRTR